MARPLRIEMADGVYHVSSRGLGDRFGGVGPAAVWHVVRRVDQQRRRDAKLRDRLSAVMRDLKLENLILKT